MMAARCRVAVLEDHIPTREYFAQCVRDHPELELVGCFGSILDARAWFAVNDADVFLTDLGLPDGHGLSLIRSLGESHPRCEVLVISVFADAETVIDCVEAGAVGYIHKDSQPEDVANAILEVRNGASPISPMIARGVLERIRGRASIDREAAAVALSPTESEVLELIARGYAYAEIARLRGVSIGTVQTHVKRLYSKLAVHSRSEAVFEATQLGLLESLRSS
jgi:DNA-binding NarL/FixJ family response regulator